MLDRAMKRKLTGTQYSYSWANEVCAGDNEERAVVISSMNGFQYAVAAWLPIVIFPQTMAPDFRKLSPIPPDSRNLAHPYSAGYGFPTTFGLVIASIVGVVIIQILVLRDRRIAKRVAVSTEGGA